MALPKVRGLRAAPGAGCPEHEREMLNYEGTPSISLGISMSMRIRDSSSSELAREALIHSFIHVWEGERDVKSHQNIKKTQTFDGRASPYPRISVQYLAQGRHR